FQKMPTRTNATLFVLDCSQLVCERSHKMNCILCGKAPQGTITFDARVKCSIVLTLTATLSM
ncbi:MAG: hypothetical protein ACI4HN_01685, partial [Ruminococcus sp.]